jgi:hypothetical protein
MLASFVVSPRMMGKSLGRLSPVRWTVIGCPKWITGGSSGVFQFCIHTFRIGSYIVKPESFLSLHFGDG